MALTTEKEMLLREYQFAGEICRNHDSLVRTGMIIFGAAQAAILAFLASNSDTAPLVIGLLKGLGFWLSVIVFATTYRLSHRYRTYMERARSLESQLHFDLYDYSEREFQRRWLLKHMPGNKWWWGSLPFLLALAYGYLLFCDLWPHLAIFVCGNISP